jgi:hypothetical protein
MADRELPNNTDILSVKEMQEWMREEIRDSAKAHELRTSEATQLVEDYAAGRINGEAAMERLYAHDRRWGDALFGTHASEHKDDAAILKAIDTAREDVARRIASRTSRGGSKGY